jgi:alpha-tubulin suppressor-like RCC1 family protein
MEQVSGVFFVRYSTAWQMWVLKADGSIVRKFSSGGSLVNGGAFEARAESGFSQVNVWANVDCPVAFKEDGSAWMMNGPSGATTTETLGAFKRLSLPDVVAVYPTYGASGPNYGSCSTAFAVKTDGTVWVVGDNSFGKVGNGTTSNVASWTQVL